MARKGLMMGNKIISFSILEENYKKISEYCSKKAINRSLFIVQSVLKNIKDNEETYESKDRSSDKTGKGISNNNGKGFGKKRSSALQGSKGRTIGRKSGSRSSKSNTRKSDPSVKTKGRTPGTEEIEISDF